MKIRFLFLMMSLFFVSSCALRAHDVTPLMTQKQRLHILKNANHFQLSGGIALKTSQKKLSGSFAWEQWSISHYAFNVSGPFGIGSSRILATKTQTVLTDDHGKNYVGANAHILMQQCLGWSIPVSAFYYWIRGLPVPGKSYHANYNHYGRVILLKQMGWNIHFVMYRVYDRHIDMPSQILFQGPHIQGVINIQGWAFF